MTIYIYRNYISDDEEIMMEKIELLLGENYHDIGTVESIADIEWDNVEEVQASAHDLFSYMREAYIFLAHIGKES